MKTFIILILLIAVVVALYFVFRDDISASLKRSSGTDDNEKTSDVAAITNLEAYFQNSELLRSTIAGLVAKYPASAISPSDCSYLPYDEFVRRSKEGKTRIGDFTVRVGSRGLSSIQAPASGLINHYGLKPEILIVLNSRCRSVQLSDVQKVLTDAQPALATARAVTPFAIGRSVMTATGLPVRQGSSDVSETAALTAGFGPENSNKNNGPASTTRFCEPGTVTAVLPIAILDEWNVRRYLTLTDPSQEANRLFEQADLYGFGDESLINQAALHSNAVFGATVHTDPVTQLVYSSAFSQSFLKHKDRTRPTLRKVLTVAGYSLSDAKFVEKGTGTLRANLDRELMSAHEYVGKTNKVEPYVKQVCGASVCDGATICRRILKSYYGDCDTYARKVVGTFCRG